MTPDERILFAKQNMNRVYARFTPQWAFKKTARRTLVVMFYLLLVATISLTTMLFQAMGKPTLWLIYLLPILMWLAFVPMIWLTGATNAVANKPPFLLDERERAKRYEIYYTAYRILAGMATLLYFANGLAQMLHIKLPNIQPSIMFAFFFILSGILPTQVAAWTLTDIPQD